MSLPTDFASISQFHFDDFVSRRVAESGSLEFKRDIPAEWTDKVKNEVLADISAFSNAGGGDIVYGIEQDKEGVAKAIRPQIFAEDHLTLRIQDLVKNCTEPRLPGVRYRSVSVCVGGVEGAVLVVRIPQSWTSPHRVSFSKDFYLREGGRKRELNVPEVRGIFLRSESQAQRIRDFRTDRISRIISGEGAPKLAGGVCFVVHLIPTDAALGLMQVDPLQYFSSANARRLPLIHHDDNGVPMVNLDGALLLRHTRNEMERSRLGHSLFFRNGFFEATRVFEGNAGALSSGKPDLPFSVYEGYVIRLVERLREELRLLNRSTDMTVMLTVLRADLGEWRFGRTAVGTVDRPTLVLPDVAVSGDVDVIDGLKPVFDLLAQACGMASSPGYDEQGKYIVR